MMLTFKSFQDFPQVILLVVVLYHKFPLQCHTKINFCMQNYEPIVYYRDTECTYPISGFDCH